MLRDELEKLFQEVLPTSPEKAINGTELIKLLRQKKFQGNDGSLRTYFSVMSGDPTSSIAKVDEGQGYYRRPSQDNIESNKRNSGKLTDAPNAKTKGRAEQREEKFRALFMRWSEQEGEFPVHIEHTRGARQRAGINRWKYPDVVSVKWYDSTFNEAAAAGLDKTLTDLKRSLGEQPFRISSTELKVEVDAASLRESFFQCVSNSRWAHSSQLGSGPIKFLAD